MWDISGLCKNTPHTGPGAFKYFDTFFTVKYILERHDRGFNFVTFHLTLPLIISRCGRSDDQNLEDEQDEGVGGRFLLRAFQ
jgi:hypothetical protein